MRQRRTKWHNVLTGEQGSVMLAALDGRPLAGIACALMIATFDSLRESGIGHVHLWTLRDTPR